MWWFQIILHIHLGSLARWSNLTNIFQTGLVQPPTRKYYNEEHLEITQGDARSVADWQLLQLPVDTADGVGSRHPSAEPLSAESFTERVQGPMASVESSALAVALPCGLNGGIFSVVAWIIFSPGPVSVCLFFFVGWVSFLGWKGFALINGQR